LPLINSSFIFLTRRFMSYSSFRKSLVQKEYSRSISSSLCEGVALTLAPMHLKIKYLPGYRWLRRKLCKSWFDFIPFRYRYADNCFCNFCFYYCNYHLHIKRIYELINRTFFSMLNSLRTNKFKNA